MNLNEIYKEQLRITMSQYWGYDMRRILPPCADNHRMMKWIVDRTEECTCWRHSGSDSSAAWYVMMNLDSDVFKPPLSETLIENHITQRDLGHPDNMSVAGLKNIIRLINNCDTHALNYRLILSGNKAVLLRRVKFALYMCDTNRLLDKLEVAMRGLLVDPPDIYSGPFETLPIVLPRSYYHPTPRVTIDLTTHPPPPPKRTTYSNVIYHDPIFDMNLSELTSMLPRVSGNPQPLHKSDDIEITSVQLSNRDPLSLTQISIPVRGSRCMHSACYDLEMFLLFARQQQKNWKCPLCEEDVPPDKLVFVEHNFVDSMLM